MSLKFFVVRQEYIRSIDGSFRDEELKKSQAILKEKGLTKQRELMSSIAASLMRLAVGSVCMAAYMQLAAHYPISRISEEAFINSNDYKYRAFYTFMALMGDEMKYCSVWKVAEAGCIMTGFGFEGVNEKGAVIGYRGVENIDILGFNFATNIAERSRYWNKGTQSWLERYIYRRTGNSLVATYFVSSLWHGMYPGYYMFFLSVPLLTSVERMLRLKINPILIPDFDPRDPKTVPRGVVATIYYIVCWFVTMVVLFYIGQPFSQFSFERSWRVLASYNFIPYGVCVVSYLVLSLIPSARKKGDAADKKTK